MANSFHGVADTLVSELALIRNLRRPTLVTSYDVEERNKALGRVMMAVADLVSTVMDDTSASIRGGGGLDHLAAFEAVMNCFHDEIDPPLSVAARDLGERLDAAE